MKRSLFRRQALPNIPPGLRVYAIGDVHGRIDLYEMLIGMIERDNAARAEAETAVVLLGDLIDRGPRSREVVQHAMRALGWARTVAIMGNHEAVMLDVLDGNVEQLRDWLRFGGRETLASWGIAPDEIERSTLAETIERARGAVTREERNFLGRMKPFARFGDYYFVHAGVRPGVPLETQTGEDQMWIREDFLESRKSHGAMIVHGHSISTDIEERSNRIGLDTGAYATGRLTAIGLEGGDRWFLSTAGAA